MRILRAVVLSLAATLPACSGGAAPGPDVQAITEAFVSSHLALVLFDTGGAPIPDEPKLTARMTVIDNGGVNLPDSQVFHYDGSIGIELRGGSSLRFFPKKQYSVETRDESGEDLDFPLLGLPEEEDWVFHGPYSDKTLLRNWFAYGLASELGAYAPRTRFVEVFLNGLYWGVYLFTEKIKRDGNRVDISKLRSDDNAEPEVTGGYLLEMTESKEAGATYVETTRALLELKDPKPSDATPQQLAWIRNYVQAFEDALHGPGFEDPALGWRAFADEDSLVDYVVFQELLRNRDAFKRSTFFSKDRGGLLRAGPVWDFNGAMGNQNNQREDQSPEGFLFRADGTWVPRLLSDRAFADRVIARYRELREGPFSTASLLARVDAGVALLADAADRNFERWPVIGTVVEFNPSPAPQSYAEEVEALKAWLTARAQWLDANIETIG